MAARLTSQPFFGKDADIFVHLRESLCDKTVSDPKRRRFESDWWLDLLFSYSRIMIFASPVRVISPVCLRHSVDRVTILLTSRMWVTVAVVVIVSRMNVGAVKRIVWPR